MNTLDWPYMLMASPDMDSTIKVLLMKSDIHNTSYMYLKQEGRLISAGRHFCNNYSLKIINS